MTKPPENQALCSVDLAALVANYCLIVERTSPARVACVVKCDGYGLGMGPVADALHAAGCEHFYVSHINEGIALRALLPDVWIGVLHGVNSEEEARLCPIHRLQPVLNHEGQLALWRAEAQRIGRALHAYCHIDTGMKRLGFNRTQFVELLDDRDAWRGLRLSQLLSHFACADTPDHLLNHAQLSACDALREQMPDLPISLHNSFGCFQFADHLFEEVRPGAALYGLNPAPTQPNPMQPVVTLTAPFVQLRKVAEGGTAGYGATYQTPQGTLLGTLPVGYGDGLPRSLSNRGSVVVHYDGGKMSAPIAGRVSMDLITVDLSALPEHAFHGHMLYAELLGVHQSADDLASQAGTIGYEILTGLGRRYARVYNPL